MKTKLILCLLLVLLANFAFAESVEIQISSNSPPDWNLPVSVQVTDEGFGKHFIIFFKADKDSDGFIGAALSINSEDNQIASCLLEKNWTTNGVRFEFTVSTNNLPASKFRVSELAHIGKQPMPSVTAYWFYLRDFVTNNARPVSHTSSSEVSPEIIKDLPDRTRALRAGAMAEDVWKQLNLAAYERHLSNDEYPDRYRLNWQYAIEFTFENMTNGFTVEKSADGKTSIFKDNRKLIRAILYKNGLEVARSER